MASAHSTEYMSNARKNPRTITNFKSSAANSEKSVCRTAKRPNVHTNCTRMSDQKTNSASPRKRALHPFALYCTDSSKLPNVRLASCRFVVCAKAAVDASKDAVTARIRKWRKDIRNLVHVNSDSFPF